MNQEECIRLVRSISKGDKILILGLAPFIVEKVDHYYVYSSHSFYSKGALVDYVLRGVVTIQPSPKSILRKLLNE